MRPIDADALIRRICGMKCGCEREECGYDEAGCPKVRDLETAPTISPDEVRGVGEITGDDACPSCGCWIPTDDAHDAIFKNEVKFCYYCGMRLRMKGAEDEDGTTDTEKY